MSAKERVATTIRAQFAEYLANHPHAGVEGFLSSDGKEQAFLTNAWNDSSVAFWVRDDAAELADALRNLILPERLTAIWHKDTRQIEVIWTAQKLPEMWLGLATRAFDFDFEGSVYPCRFSASSDRLMILAKNYVSRSASATNYRNLQTYWSYQIFDKQHHKLFNFADTPWSFWIDNVDWDEITTINLIEHLNFYMTYFDRRGPFIYVHIPPAEPKVAERTRYLHGAFPTTIKAVPLDKSLLSFWNVGYVSNPMMSYLFYYRILEYAAFNFIDYEVRRNIAKLLNAPNRSGIDVDGVIGKILDFMAAKTLDGPSRLKRVVRQNVDPALLWRDIHANKDVFSADTTFDGGFVMRALISKNETEKTFCDRSLDGFTDQLRLLRNTLAHGKQEETAGVIEATERNIRLIRPWMHLLATAAGEVILYKDVS